MENQNFGVTEIEISYRPAFRVNEQPQVTSSDKAYRIMLEKWDLWRLELLEEFKVILLNNQCRLLGLVNIAQGGFSEVMLDQKVIFAVALKFCASGLILVHNPPSGALKPSEADLRLTRNLSTGGNILGLKVHDHLIVSRFGYYSFGDEGLI